MTKDEVMKQLEKYGNDSIRKTYLRHEAMEPFLESKWPI